MTIVVNIIILIGLIKLLEATNKPLVCAIVYTIVVGLFAIILYFGSLTIAGLAIILGLKFLLAFIYFWLLQKLDGTFFWWIVMLGGFFIGFV